MSINVFPGATALQHSSPKSTLNEFTPSFLLCSHPDFNMKFFTLGATLALFSKLTSAAPFPDAPEIFGTRSINLESSPTMEKRALWSFRPGATTGCPAGGTATGSQSICVGVSGKSIVASGSCSLSTWSGGNCQGSSHVVTPGCNDYTYASVKIVC